MTVCRINISTQQQQRTFAYNSPQHCQTDIIPLLPSEYDDAPRQQCMCCNCYIQHQQTSVGFCEAVQARLLFLHLAVYYNSLPAEETGPTIDTSKYPPSEGITIELCAGIVDKDKCLEEIAKDEILEECGYDVPISSIKKITSFKSGVGVSGSVQTLFYAEVTDGMRQHSGGGNTCEGEEIDVVDLTLSEAKALIFNEDVPRPVTLILALMWFFDGNMSLTNLPNKL
ncbi:uridine diphosphate glucose pyrophosphatase-like isoform X2 [Limulus polyphemus]|uniref:Uridine diphosphate glucose pyrophosphatase-like isoform X2 n=1 Tax=Limulus polyphemus TaxID=6850 RepID=A0ABM1SST1_LIMPO|nr:uridine diphosphate glucose pyrophosphatase-like isoform X2 [Limulus polyphemus]